MSIDSAQYERLAAIYDASFRIPVRRCDTANFLAATVPLLVPGGGTRVLDLATGTGYFARAMARHGAAHVVGVDVSEAMLSMARHLSAEADEEKVRYEIGDVFGEELNLKLEGEEGDGKGTFDLVTGVWCLNYAGDAAMMQRAWRNIAAFLKPGGRFVGIVPNKSTMEAIGEGTVYYGFSYERLAEVADGLKARKTMHAETGPITFNAYFLRESVYQDAAEMAGMREVRLDEPTVVPALEDGEDEAFWARFLERPLFKVMTAVKA